MIFNLRAIAFFCAIFFLFLAFTSGKNSFLTEGTNGDTISRSKFKFERQLPPSGNPPTQNILFPSTFTSVEGITTFRGGPYRDMPSYGTIARRPKLLKIKWSYSTRGDAKWGGGAGWTGQPLIIKWQDSVRAIMNVAPAFKNNANFKEVILGTLDGKIYFHDLETGNPSRPPINVQNPIKGTLSLDPRGWPVLYAGQGISNTGEFGVRIFSLIDQRKIFFINGRDSFAHRPWAAFDGAPLIDGRTDAMFLGGENGLVYSIALHSSFKSVPPQMSVAPEATKYRYQLNTTQYQGIESTLVGYKNKLYFCDNNGFIQCLSANSLEPEWIVQNHDDTDATLVLEEENGVPFLYTGNEVDIQGAKGFTYVKKLNGHDGATIWQNKFECQTVRGAHPVNGGMLSTPVVGKQNGRGLAVFSISRYKGMNKGLLVALKKSTGEPAWEVLLDNYAWSSPLDIYDRQGNMYIFLADSKGFVMLFDGITGAEISKLKIADLFEASPVAYDNMIVIASRPRDVFCLEVE
jgi:outer membrane protein assembly factor BamB